MTAAEYLVAAREAVRLANVTARQIDAHGWQLNQDQIDYMRDVAAAARVTAREHLRQAALANRAKQAA
jgi:hypothetical protein